MPSSVFGLNGPRDLMTLVEENFKDLWEKPDERRLVNCVLTTWHMMDWVLHTWLSDKSDPEHLKRWTALTGQPSIPSNPKKQEDAFRDWLKTQCPASDHLREVANHTKHLKHYPTSKRLRVSAMLFAPHHEPVWGITVTESSGKPKPVDIFCRHHGSGTALNDVIAFWKKFLDVDHPDWT